jgi:hypothetical protein
MLNYIPATALLSKVVPAGMESSCFAFLAGINNFASMISELSGGLIFEAAGIKTTSSLASEGRCNFDALWWLIILCHVSLPIVIGVPAAWLIPNVLQTESLTTEPAPPPPPLLLQETMSTNLVSDTDSDI